MKKNIFLSLAILFATCAASIVLAQQTLPTSGGYYLIKNQGINDIYVGGTGTGNNSVRIENASVNTFYHYFLITGDNTTGWTMQQVQTSRYITHDNNYTGSYATATSSNRQLFKFDNTTNTSYIIIQKKQDNGNFANGLGSDDTSGGGDKYVYMDKGTDKNNKWLFVPMNADLQTAIDKATALYADGSGNGAAALQTAIEAAQSHLSPSITSGDQASVQAAIDELSAAVTALNAAMAAYRTANPWTGSGLTFGAYHTALDFDGLTAFPAGWSGTAIGDASFAVSDKITLSASNKTGLRGGIISFPGSGNSNIVYSEFELTLTSSNITNNTAFCCILQDNGTNGQNRIFNLYVTGSSGKFYLQNPGNATDILSGTGTSFTFNNAANNGNISTNVSYSSGSTYKIRYILDFDNQKVVKLFIDNTVVASDIAFLSSAATNVSKMLLIHSRESGVNITFTSSVDNFEIGELVPTNYAISGDADLQTIDGTEVSKTYNVSGYQPALGIDVAIPFSDNVTWEISNYNGVSSSIVSLTKDANVQTQAVLKTTDAVSPDTEITISATVGTANPATKAVTLKTVDLSALKAALLSEIATATALDDAISDSNGYLTTIIGALTSAISTAQVVYDNAGATAAQINYAITALQSAESTFSAALSAYNNFVSLIATAQSIHDAETSSGTAGIKATLQTAINAATAARSTIADATALTNAVAALQDAINAFNTAPRTILIADFESGGLNPSFQDNGGCASNSVAVVNNPDKTCTLNTTNKALYAQTNGSSQDWWKGIEIDITDFTVSTSTGRYLHILMRTDLSKFEWDIHTNEDNWSGSSTNHAQNNTWFDYVIDLQSIKGTTNLNGKTVTALRIAFSTNEDANRNKEIWIDEIVLSNNASERGVCAATSNATVITIDAATQYQTIEGFGASDCWAGDFVGRYFSTAHKGQVAKWLFSQNTGTGNPEGIGLSLWRVNLGAGSLEQGSSSNIGNQDDNKVYRRAGNFLSTYNAANYSSISALDFTKQPGQRYFMEQAKDYGCESFLLFSNSPPVGFTLNDKSYSANSNTANLTSDKYDDFAAYMTDVAAHFINEGYPVKYISPVNEPQWKWDDNAEQEGSPWTNAQIRNLAVELNSAINTRMSGIAESAKPRILIAEASYYKHLYTTSSEESNNTVATNQIEAFFNSSNTSTYVGNLKYMAPVIAGHAYFSNDNNTSLANLRTSVKSKAAEYGIGFHQTEWCMLESNMPDNFPSSYSSASTTDIALQMARLIHADMAIADASSWSYWTAMDNIRWDQKTRFSLIALQSEDNNYTQPTNDGPVYATKNLWALGNYSLFVRPGYKRIALTGAADLGGLMGTAYLAPDNSKVVAVYVNMATATKSVKMDIQNWNGSATATGSMYITDLSNNLQKNVVASGIAYNAENEITIPARSVVTLVYELPERTSFVVNTSKTSSEYLAGLYDDIIFEDGGQLTIDQSNDAGGLKPYGVVKVLKTFEKGKWYAVGFPFNIASVRCNIDGFDDYDLATYKPDGSGSDWGDYWLRTYDGTYDTFNDYTSGATTLAAGGYVLQVPQAFDGAEFTFTSPTGVTLGNSSNFATVAGEYILTSNPSVANLSITPAAPFNYYCYEYTGKTSNFGLLDITRSLKPFESLVVAKDIQGALRSSLGVEQSTGTIRPEGEQPIAVQYYNLQGVVVPQPLKGNIYIVKKIYKNQASEFTKIILK